MVQWWERDHEWSLLDYIAKVDMDKLLFWGMEEEKEGRNVL